MSVLQIKSVQHNGNNLYTVQAVVQDSYVVHAPTYFEPAEYGDGLCEAQFILADDESLPSDSDDLEQFVHELELNWIPIDWD